LPQSTSKRGTKINGFVMFIITKNQNPKKKLSKGEGDEIRRKTRERKALNVDY
jgi:hypothetical protein